MNMNLEQFLVDLSYESKYIFLEEGKDADELATVAGKRGIKLPAHDLAPFKCIYAFIDRQNLNGCTLPKAEVEKALETLVGKAIDFDHLRKNVVGHWIDAKLEDDKIVAYGVFFKGNFEDDYVMIKDLMEKGILAISFEAYGNKVMKENGGYDLVNIEFSGGALLIKTSPAFPGSEVQELASKQKEKVLEFAKVMTAPKEYFHINKELAFDKKKEYSKEPKKWVKEHKGTMEESNLIFQDLETIHELLTTVPCPYCKEKALGKILMIDLEEYLLRVKCFNCEAIAKVDLTPAVKLLKKGKKPDIGIIKADIIKEEKGEQDMKEKDKGNEALSDKLGDKFTVKCKSCSYIFKSDVRGESTQCTKCGGFTETQGIDKDGVPEHMKGEEEKVMKEKIEALEKEVTTLKEQIEAKDTEIVEKSEALEKSTATVEEMKKESEEVKVKIEEIEQATTEKIEKAREDATKVAERKAELGDEFSKDIDLLDDGKYELAKIKKSLAARDEEISTLKKNQKEPEIKKDLDKGSKDKEDIIEDEVTIKAKKVKSLAFGDQE